MASKSRITRRGLLRFAGSTSVMAALSPFVPVLESDVEAAGGVPIRLILMYWPVGTDYVNFLCGGGQTDFELSPSLSSLEPHRDKLLILQGIDNQAARLSLSDGGHRGIHSIWTGQPNGEGNFSGGGTPHNFGWPVGISVDQYLAQEIGKTETWRFSSIEASTNTDPYAAPWNNRMSFSGPQEPVPTEDDPREVWKRLFADLDIDPAQYEQFRAAKQSVIDVVKDDVARLQAKVGAADRHKIDRHLENLRSVEERILSSGQQCRQPGDRRALRIDQAAGRQSRPGVQVRTDAGRQPADGPGDARLRQRAPLVVSQRGQRRSLEHARHHPSVLRDAHPYDREPRSGARRLGNDVGQQHRRVGVRHLGVDLAQQS
jgi:hypothetical protein